MIKIKKHNKNGSALMMAIIFIQLLLLLVASLVVTLNTHYKDYYRTKNNIMIKHVMRSVVELTLASLNYYDENVLEIQGNADNIDSVILKMEDEDWYDLEVEDNEEENNNGNGKGKAKGKEKGKGKFKSKNADITYENIEKELEIRPSKDFKVILEPHGNGFIAYCYIVYEKIEYAIKAYLIKKPISQPSGIFGVRNIEFLGNGGIDSYDSSQGEYSLNNKSQECEIGTNYNIKLSKFFMIYGNAKYGALGDINYPENITGELSHQEEVELNPVDQSWLNIEEDLDCLDQKKSDINTIIHENIHYSKVNLNGKLIIEGNCKIYCHGDFHVLPQSSIELKTGANLTLYVGGNFTFKGEIISSNYKPSDFKINIIGNDKNIEPKDDSGWTVDIINMEKELKAIINAPKANVKLILKNHFFGSIIGYRIKVVGIPEKNKHEPVLHCDLALIEENKDKNEYYLELIQEIKAIK